MGILAYPATGFQQVGDTKTTVSENSLTVNLQYVFEGKNNILA